MRKVIALSLACLVGLAAHEGLSAGEKADKTERKAQQKAVQNVADMAHFEEAVQALNNGRFVLEADRLQYPVAFGRGGTRPTMAYVIPTNNYVLSNDGQGMIQWSIEGGPTLQNGAGGYTLAGDAVDVKITTNRKGDVNYRYTVRGNGMNNTVFITLPYGSNFATARVADRTFYGKLYPAEESSVFKGLPFKPVPRGLQ